MKSEVYHMPDSVFDGKTLKEILDLIEDWPVVNPKLDEAKKLFERPEIREAVRKAFREGK